MYPNGNRSSSQSAALAPGSESEELAWRLSHKVEALQETIAVLRDGANELAIDNAILRIENERLRKAARLASPKRS
jgi:regulator of replication initiation timing